MFHGPWDCNGLPQMTRDPTFHMHFLRQRTLPLLLQPGMLPLKPAVADSVLWLTITIFQMATRCIISPMWLIFDANWLPNSSFIPPLFIIFFRIRGDEVVACTGFARGVNLCGWARSLEVTSRVVHLSCNPCPMTVFCVAQSMCSI